jgi:hypothetical protein
MDQILRFFLTRSGDVYSHFGKRNCSIRGHLRSGVKSGSVQVRSSLLTDRFKKLTKDFEAWFGQHL